MPDGVKQRLRMRAAANGRSMEAEARTILVAALSEDRRVDLGWIDQLVVAAGAEGIDVPEVDDDPAGIAGFER